MTRIPLLDLAAQHDPIHGEIMQAIERVIRSQHYILGPEVESLEARVASYCGAAHAVGVSSGTDALLAALMAWGIGPGDEVVTTTFSFFATAGAISRVGARPVFVDIDEGTYNIDPGKIEAALTPRTKVIIPVHLYGQCAEMDSILALAGRRGLKVLEDAAQAIGSEYRDGRRACSMGDAGCLSFFPSKNLGALGDAGMVVTRDAAFAEKVRVVRVHGSKPKYHHAMIGGNFRLDAIQAAVLGVKLHHLDAWTRARQENAGVYEKAFGDSFLVRDGHITLPRRAYGAGIRHGHIYNQYVIRALRRDGLRKHLEGAGVATEVYYPVPFHLQACFFALGYSPGDFPASERAARETLALPVYPGLSREGILGVVSRIEEFYRSDPRSG